MNALRVLLVDDEPDFLEPTAARLARRGILCATAASGEAALEVLQREPFDCAVVDVKMPGLGGLELLQRIRQDWPDVRVVLLTGHASLDLGVRGMELGAVDYLLKPVELDDLLDTLRCATPRL